MSNSRGDLPIEEQIELVKKENKEANLLGRADEREKDREERIRIILDELADDGELSQRRADELLQLVTIDTAALAVKFSDLSREDVGEKLILLGEGIAQHSDTDAEGS